MRANLTINNTRRKNSSKIISKFSCYKFPFIEMIFLSSSSSCTVSWLISFHFSRAHSRSFLPHYSSPNMSGMRSILLINFFLSTFFLFRFHCRLIIVVSLSFTFFHLEKPSLLKSKSIEGRNC